MADVLAVAALREFPPTIVPSSRPRVLPLTPINLWTGAGRENGFSSSFSSLTSDYHVPSSHNLTLSYQIHNKQPWLPLTLVTANIRLLTRRHCPLPCRPRYPSLRIQRRAWPCHHQSTQIRALTHLADLVAQLDLILSPQLARIIPATTTAIVRRAVTTWTVSASK